MPFRVPHVILNEVKNLTRPESRPTISEGERFFASAACVHTMSVLNTAMAQNVSQVCAICAICGFVPERSPNA